jgi:hypothetical protein
MIEHANPGDAPDVAELAKATVELLRQGVRQSEHMRQRLALTYGINPSGISWPRFVNNHAWALVRLQAAGAIRKLAPGHYELAPAPEGTLLDIATPAIPADANSPLPRWAREMVVRATWKNAKRWQAAPFTEEDLRALWDKCGGRCKLTGLPFKETQIGTGRARKPHAPSLDRIDPELPYTRGNCRLVLQAVNFALNAWGDAVFFEVSKAAVAQRRSTGHE